MIFPILALVVIIGVIAGLLRKGDLQSILKTRVYHPEFLVASILCALTVSITNIDTSGVIAFVALATAFVFTVMNLHLVGMIILSLGLALNLFVFILNFETPVRPNALVEAEIATAAEIAEVELMGHLEIADGDTIFSSLGDTFPVRGLNVVVSIGDLIFLVGLANLTGNLMLGNQRHKYGEYFMPDTKPNDELDGLDSSTDAQSEPEPTPTEKVDAVDAVDAEAISSSVYPEFESTVYPQANPKP